MNPHHEANKLTADFAEVRPRMPSEAALDLFARAVEPVVLSALTGDSLFEVLLEHGATLIRTAKVAYPDTAPNNVLDAAVSLITD